MKMKKMTAKEFKEILEMANVSTDFEALLSIIANQQMVHRNDMKAKGYEQAARSYEESFNTIYNELDERGYFDRVF